ncbi:4-alpha-glucanotransferase [Salinibius halmophilus]|uniref:4-alpha-glucanotransferase n=1 Tax=Salinibius halmophilus TaxID=1853216 RepID=UPI000E66819F|nr:4-alpha-glucanotransferase [Salinibius halmophilus]
MSKRTYYGHELLHGFVNAAGQWQEIDEKSRNIVASALSKTANNLKHQFHVITQDGCVQVPFDQQAIGQVIEVNWAGEQYRYLSHDLPFDNGLLSVCLPWREGQHGELTINVAGVSVYHSIIAIAPSCAVAPPTNRLWGPAVQLYSLRRHDDWGIGDFSSLVALIEQLAPYQPGFIGLNPLHALSLATPEMASPYSPGDRAWLNIWYLDPDATPFADAISGWRARKDVTEWRERVRQQEFIDYPAVVKIKWQALARQFAVASKSSHWQAFCNWRAEQGDTLEYYAQHEAKSICKRGKNVKSRLVTFIAFCQWLAVMQLQQAQAACEKLHMPVGLYIDLAVGCVGSGSEGKRRAKQLVSGLDMGAPPDPFGPTGQIWGMPITHPEALAATSGKDFVELMDANMALGGALRIDHAMGLMRIWAVPSHAPATEGAYVNYDFQSHVALLNLVSQKRDCVVVAEDLGTVPDEVRETFPAQNYLSMQVLLYEREGDRLPTYRTVKRQALALLSSHDMPPLACYWQGEDIDLRRQLGLLDEQQANEQYQEREHARWAIANTIGYRSDHWDEEMLVRLHEYLAASPAQWVSIQLEDLLFESRPVNIPGTEESQYPNWRRRLTQSVIALDESKAAQRVLQVMASERGFA